MLKDFTFGQYFSALSPIHKMDPRFKIVQMVALLVLTFLADGFTSLFIIAAAVVLIVILSKVPLKMYLKNLKPILPIIIITAVLNALYVTEGTVLFSWWIFTVSTGGIIRAAYMTFRIVLLIVISSVLTYTTTPTELTDGIESLFSPLKLIGLGEVVHTIAMMMTIALRFIPTLTDEADKIMSAQKARGADLDNGGLFKRLKALMPILIPLLISSIRRAYELAEAMECRCYSGGKGRTRMKKLKATYLDLIATVFSVVICGVVVVLRII